MIAELLDDSVATVEGPLDVEPGPIHPDEHDIVSDASPKRVHEFSVGRHLARVALARVGAPTGPLLRGPDRDPLWPSGFVGSISHCDHWCAAAVASLATHMAIGIDVEVDEPLPSDVRELVLRPEERTLAEKPSSSDRIVFSAKESVFKAWFPITRAWLDFHDVRVTLDPGAGRFEADLRGRSLDVDGVRLTALEGRYMVGSGLLATAICVARLR